MNEALRSGTKEEVGAFKRELAEACAAKADEIYEINGRGEPAVIVINPVKDARTAALMLGWDGKTSPAVLRMKKRDRERMAKSDAVTERWFKRSDTGCVRIFVIMEAGNWLLNFADGKFFFEPGSLDSERV
jgi:hypothetical protein